MSQVVISSRADLDNVIKALQELRKNAKETELDIQNAGKKTDEVLRNTGKQTEQTIKNSSSVMRRMANQLYSDFKSLMSLQALQKGLALSNQFSGAISESITLSDTIRRLGGSFGIARENFGKFQSDLAKGLGNIGASSESASAALEGLVGLGVKGSESIQNLSKGAVTLAGMSGEKGNEKNIASLLGRTLQAQGKDVNDVQAQQRLIGEVTAAQQATGMQASQILGAMDQIMSTMDKSLRSQIGPEGLAQMATIAATIGPQATAAMQEYLSKSKIDRLGMESQGVNFFGKDGQIDVNKLTDFVKNAQSRIGMDPRKALQTFGFSEEAAEGLVRIGEQSDRVAENMEKLAKSTRDNEQAFRQSMGLMDSFRGSINTVKGSLEGFFGNFTQGLTDLLQSQVGSKAGSAAVVLGGGILASVLAGGGLRGIGKGLGGMLGGELKKEAYEQVTGEKVTPVYVVNASEIGGSGLASAGGALASLGGMAAKAGLVGVAGAAGYGVGSLANKGLDAYTQGKTSEGFEGNAIERLMFKLDQLIGGSASTAFNKNQKLILESKVPDLMIRKDKQRRGASN